MNIQNHDLLSKSYHQLVLQRSLSPRDLVPKSPIGKELRERFLEQEYRGNPSESPMARALVAHGYHVVDYPLYPEYTDSDWLASCVFMGGMKIIFRQPTPQDVAICFMKREEENQKMASPLFGITEFFSFCRYDCPGLSYVGGNLDKHVELTNNILVAKLACEDEESGAFGPQQQRVYRKTLESDSLLRENDAEGTQQITSDVACSKKSHESKLTMDRLVTFYNRMLGDIESYEENGVFFIYAELHRDQRFEKFPIWKRVRRTMIRNKKCASR